MAAYKLVDTSLKSPFVPAPYQLTYTVGTTKTAVDASGVLGSSAVRVGIRAFTTQAACEAFRAALAKTAATFSAYRIVELDTLTITETSGHLYRLASCHVAAEV